MKDGLPRIESLLSPELETPNRLHLPVVRAAKIRLCGADTEMAHHRLKSSKVIPIIQERGGDLLPINFFFEISYSWINPSAF
jgi:hypothetical protein